MSTTFSNDRTLLVLVAKFESIKRRLATRNDAQGTSHMVAGTLHSAYQNAADAAEILSRISGEALDELPFHALYSSVLCELHAMSKIADQLAIARLHKDAVYAGSKLELAYTLREIALTIRGLSVSLVEGWSKLVALTATRERLTDRPGAKRPFAVARNDFNCGEDDQRISLYRGIHSQIIYEDGKGIAVVVRMSASDEKIVYLTKSQVKRNFDIVEL